MKPIVFSRDAAVVRYQVRDVERSVAFYTQHLGFEVKEWMAPVIAFVSRGDLQLILSGAKSSGARSTPGGLQQEPGGWNRIVLYVNSIDAAIESLTKANVHFRNEIESGPGGKQILVDDPDGNAVELHEAPT